MKKLIHYFTGKPLLVNLFTIFIIIVGTFALSRINKEGYPKVDRRRMYITTIYPGASPDEVELNVTIPLEDAIKGLNGIKEYSSVSKENYSSLRVYFDDDIKDLEKVKSDLRRAIDNTQLPAEISKRPQIFEWKVSAIPVLEIAFFSKGKSYRHLRTRAKDLKKKLMQIGYVSQIDERNILDKEVKIKLNLKKLNDNYISIQEVINILQMNNFEITGGTYKDGNKDKIISVFSKLETIQDVRNIILRSTFEGNKIYLKDVAHVIDGFEEEHTRIRLNGEPGLSLLVTKKEDSDVIKTVDAVKVEIEKFRESLKGEDLEIVYLWDMSQQTRERLKIVQNNAIIGLILVVVILFIFMNFKNAFWTAVGIPFSVAFAIIFMKYFGVTINSVSLMGIIVVMGMVVDDAIVISENIFRHQIEGKSPREAADIGTAEMANPVMTSIVTTIVSFLALYNLKGIIGEFSKEIPLVVIFVLGGSLLEALFILPSHITHKWRATKKSIKIVDRKFVIFLREKYKKLLRVVLKWRYAVVPVFIGLFFLAYFALFSGKVLKFVAFPSDETVKIYVSGNVSKGQNLDYTSKKVRLFEKRLSEYSSNVLKSYSVEIGEIGYPEKFGMQIDLTPAFSRKITGDEIVSDLRSFVSNNHSFTNIVFQQETGGPPLGRAIRVELIGNNNKKRRELADDMVKYLNSIEGIRDLTRSDEENRRKLKIIVDYEKAARVGVSPISIGQTIRTAYNGVIATKLQTPDELVEYRVVLQDRYKDRLSTLYSLYVPNYQNKLIKLSTLIRIKEVPLVSKIDHYNGDRNTIIETDMDKGKITPTEVLEKMKKDYKNFERDNPGFRISIGGEAKESEATISEMLSAFLIALVAILFILILLFRSIGQAFVVILAIPFSFIGIAFALVTHNMPLSAMALFGGVGLVGVVVNDSLVMVDYINSIRHKIKKNNIIDVIVEGAGTRLRPVILTSATTIAGLMPTAYGFGGRDFMIIPTTITMSWGLLFATLLTLLLIPCLYMIHLDIIKGSKRIIESIGKKFKTKKKRGKRTIVPIFIVGMLLTATALHAQNTNITSDDVITLDEFIYKSIDNHPELLGELIKIKSARSLEVQSRAIYNAILDVQYHFMYQNPNDKEDSNAGIVEQWNDDIGISISKVFPKLGTRVKVGVDYSQSDTGAYYPDMTTLTIVGGTNIDTNDMKYTYDTQRSYSPQFYIQLQQPLLKNWFGILDRFPLKQSALNRLITKETVDESIEGIISQLYQTYFEWFLAYYQHQIFDDNVKNSEKLLKQLKRKAKYGLVEQTDLDQVHIMNLEYKKGRDLLAVNLNRLTKTIYHWMEGSLNMPTNVIFIPQDEVNLPTIPPGPYSANNSRTMKILNMSKRLLDYQLKKEVNENLPELNFVFQYNFQNDTAEEGEVFVLSNFNHNYYTGIEFSMPIGENMSRGKIKETKARLKKWLRDVETFERKYYQGIDDLSAMIAVYKKVLEYDKLLIKHAKNRVKEEKKKYNQGRSDLYFIIENENTLVNYHIGYLKDYVEYQKIQLQLLALLDSLIEREDDE